MAPRPTVAVLIACHDRKAKTLACLASLARQDADATIHTVVFDDGCTDGTVEAVESSYPQADILIGSGDAYWAGGMRIALTHALRRDADFYLWLNDDVLLLPNALGTLLATNDTLVEAGQGLCLIGGAVADPATGLTSYGGIDRVSRFLPLRFERVRPRSSTAQSCDTLCGNVVLIPRATCAAIGTIGAAYVHTLGDLDYGLRVGQAGGWVGLAPGHVGWCDPNRVDGRWLNPALPLRARWRLLRHPLGFPLRPWLHFARAHGGPFWFIFVPLPFWRLLAPVRAAQALGRLRKRVSALFQARMHARAR